MWSSSWVITLGGDSSCYGGLAPTPRIDALSAVAKRQGLRLEQYGRRVEP